MTMLELFLGATSVLAGLGGLARLADRQNRRYFAEDHGPEPDLGPTVPAMLDPPPQRVFTSEERQALIEREVDRLREFRADVDALARKNSAPSGIRTPDQPA